MRLGEPPCEECGEGVCKKHDTELYEQLLSMASEYASSNREETTVVLPLYKLLEFIAQDRQQQEAKCAEEKKKAVQEARVDEAKDFGERLDRAVDAASGAGKSNMTVLTKALQNMRPIVLINRPDGEYAMCWDDKAELWNRARYKDLVEEAKRQLSQQDKPKGAEAQGKKS